MTRVCMACRATKKKIFIYFFDSSRLEKTELFNLEQSCRMNLFIILNGIVVFLWTHLFKHSNYFAPLRFFCLSIIIKASIFICVFLPLFFTHIILFLPVQYCIHSLRKLHFSILNKFFSTLVSIETTEFSRC